MYMITGNNYYIPQQWSQHYFLAKSVVTHIFANIDCAATYWAGYYQLIKAPSFSCIKIPEEQSNLLWNKIGHISDTYFECARTWSSFFWTISIRLKLNTSGESKKHCPFISGRKQYIIWDAYIWHNSVLPSYERVLSIHYVVTWF